MEDKISVIIPVYNVEPYLERCLDSIINNTYRNLEIICVDDGSPDGCGAILDRYAWVDDRFVVIHKENGGISSARNAGLDAATSAYVAFIDSDDWVHPQYFELLLHYLKKTDSDLAICDFARPKKVELYPEYDLVEIGVKILKLEEFYRRGASKNTVWGKLYRRELIEKSCFIEGVSFSEDVAFNALVFGKQENMKICCISLPLYFYFDRPGSLVHMLRGREMRDLTKIFAQYLETVQPNSVKRILLIEILKRGLAARYGVSILPEDSAEKTSGNRLLHKAVIALWKLPNASMKEKLMYSVFSWFPFTYRLFRIIDDPTLLQMEKNLKAQNKREA